MPAGRHKSQPPPGLAIDLRPPGALARGPDWPDPRVGPAPLAFELYYIGQTGDSMLQDPCRCSSGNSHQILQALSKN